MRTIFLAIVLAALALTQFGCAAGFKAGGRDAGVGAGATIGAEPPVYVHPEK